MLQALRQKLEDRRAKLEQPDLVADAETELQDLKLRQGKLRERRMALDLWHSSQQPELRGGLTADQQKIVAEFKDTHPAKLESMLVDVQEEQLRVDAAIRDVRSYLEILRGQDRATRAREAKNEVDAIVATVEAIAGTLSDVEARDRTVRARIENVEEMPSDLQLRGGILALLAWVERKRMEQRQGGQP